MSYIPYSMRMAAQLGSVKDRTEIWSTFYPCLRTHLEPWWADVDRWELLGVDGEENYEGEETVDQMVERAKAVLNETITFLLISIGKDPDGPNVHFSVTVGMGATGEDILIEVWVVWKNPDAARFKETQSTLRKTLWSLIEASKPFADLRWATIDAATTYADPLPSIDDFEANALLRVEPKDSFLAKFDDPTVLERTHFPEQYEVDGLIVLGRGTEATNTIEIARSSLHDTFELARAAKAGTATVRTPPWDQDAFGLLDEDEGDQQLFFVGYHPELKIAEYSCAISEPDVHLRPKEIIELCWCAGEGELPDGRPLDHVRVVFVDRDAAYRERRLLREEVKVYYMGSDLELVEVPSE